MTPPPVRRTANAAARDAPLLRIVYVSRAPRPLAAADIAGIAAASRRRNAKVGLTGVLLHDGLRFFGVLEGPSRRVLACVERIALDPRHEALRIVREEPAPERRFADWSFPMPQAGGDDRPAAFDQRIVEILASL